MGEDSVPAKVVVRHSRSLDLTTLGNPDELSGFSFYGELLQDLTIVCMIFLRDLRQLLSESQHQTQKLKN
jgi:hypothetical protein